jgi:hypothetical protein
MSLITVNEDLWENGGNLEFSSCIEDLFIGFTIFFIDLLVNFYIFKRHEKRIIYNDKHISRRELKLCQPCDQHILTDVRFTVIIISCNQIPNALCSFSAMKSCMVSINLCIASPKQIAEFDNQIISSIDRRELICYIDGSYSHCMQIGHSGFRASDGSNIVRRCSPQCPRKGSTESEVFAACLAIQYAVKNRYNSLIIRTDNSKVEQLLCHPKNKDNFDYPDFCQSLNQYREENQNNIIQVERVRGHTTRNEQNQDEKKCEFAKIDRLVRKKNRQYIRRQQMKSARFYSYQYNTFIYYRWTVCQYYFYF